METPQPAETSTGYRHNKRLQHQNQTNLNQIHYPPQPKDPYQQQQAKQQQQSLHQLHHHHHHHQHQTRQQSQQLQPKELSFDSQAQSSMAYQHKHALHRLKRLKKKSPHRDLVISFVPRLRTSIINRLDFFHRYSKQEQEVLSCFDFLDELVLNYCDGGLDSPRYCQKFYQTMIYELI